MRKVKSVVMCVVLDKDGNNPKRYVENFNE